MRATSLAALALLAGAVPPARAQGEFHWSGRLASGKRLEIKGVNGDIHAVGVTSGDVDVTARKHARRSDPESVEIRHEPRRVREGEAGVQLDAVGAGRNAHALATQRARSRTADGRANSMRSGGPTAFFQRITNTKRG